MLVKNGRVALAIHSLTYLAVVPLAGSIVAVPVAGAAENTESPEAGVQTIVVTGSHIATPELESMNPVTVLSSQSIEASGDRNISTFLRDLPSVGTSALSSTSSNFLVTNAGVNTINLRNLGDQRTLVLVNGKRYTPGVSGSGFVDFNTIPTDFIDHIEVLTGGASAIYGSDAISGVVNIIYKTDFQGLELRSQVGTSGDLDSDRYDGALLAGSSFDEGRGHFMLDLSWDKDDGLWSRNRARSAVDQNLNDDGSVMTNAFSSYAPQGRFAIGSTGGDFKSPYKVFTFDPDNNLKTGFNTPVDGFNRDHFRRISVPTDRTVFATTMNYDLADHHQLYSEFTYAFSHTKSSLEPLPLGTDSVGGAIYGGATDAAGTTIAMPISNAYLQTLPSLAPVRQAIDQFNTTNCVGTDPDCIRYVSFRKRLLDLAVRSYEANRQTGRVLLGVKGDVPLGDWKYDASFSYGRTTDSQLGTGFVNNESLRFALDSVVGPNGQIICRDPVARAEGCVPFNPFGNHSITPGAASYVGANVTRDVKVQQQVISASVSGSVGTLPAGAPQVALGVEHRKDSSEEIFDPLSNAGLSGGNQQANVDGSYTTKEVFGELELPVLKDLPAAFKLDLNAAVRHAHYSTVGNVDTWKVGLDWAPVADVRLRGVYSVAVRAPNIQELFSGSQETFPAGLVDPCNGISPTAKPGDFPAACLRNPAIARLVAQGGTLAYSLFDQQSINGFNISNANLTQEKAKTTTFGIVFTPQALPHFSATVDYYDVKIDNAINLVDPQTEINSCLANNVFCDMVIRNPDTGKIRTVSNQYLNVASIRTRGIDTTMHYGFDFGRFGTLGLGLSETHVLKLEQTVNGANLDNLGELNNNNNGRLGSGFEDRGTLNLTYDIGGFEATWRSTYMSSINDTNPTPDNPPPSALLNHVPAYVYHDVQLRYTLPTKLHAEVYAGANNVFNKQPPLLPGGVASDNTGTETAADTYDVFGVFLYAGFKVKF